MPQKWILFFIVMITLAAGAFAQEASLDVGPSAVALNQSFTITITVKNGTIKSYDDFPQLDGLVQRGKSTSSRTEYINGQSSSSYSITMNYSPEKEGTIRIKPFSMTVNGQELKYEGGSLQVGPPVQRSRDPFRSFFEPDPSEGYGRHTEPEFVEVNDEAFLALTTSEKEVYLGEGFTVDLSFYVSESNRAILQFHDLGKQLSAILKDLKPASCWEENFNIENINGESVSLNGKGYTQYKIYEATFFPFNEDTIIFKPVELEMIKYKVARNPSFFGRNREEDFKKYYSKEKKVIVKPLPPHPMKDVVTVGDYRLNETISVNQLQTGESFKYDFTVYGEGNISALENPIIPSTKKLDLYEPNVTQRINRRNQKITGSKVFSYFGIPNEPGEYKMKDYFRMIFFNPKTEKYDTLASNYLLTVTGESKKNESIQSVDLGSFYNLMNDENNQLNAVQEFNWLKIISNILILAAFLATAIILIRK